MEYALREKRGNGMGGETHVGEGSYNGEVLWVCIECFGACLHRNVFECSFSSTASQTFLQRIFLQVFIPLEPTVKLILEVCLV